MTGLNCLLLHSFPLCPFRIPSWRTVKDKRDVSLWHKLLDRWMPSRICAIMDVEFRLCPVSSGVCQTVWIRIVLKLHHWNIFCPPVERYRQVACCLNCESSDCRAFIFILLFLVAIVSFFDNNCKVSRADGHLVEWV